MELTGDKLIPASIDKTWAALNDPEVLKACVAGCETLERTGDDAFTAVVAMKVGPVSARFKGNLKMTNIAPPNGYTINFDGQGGVAGFARGTARITLASEGSGTRLTYTADTKIGGKLAQMGTRLVEGAARSMANDFFGRFSGLLGDAGAPAPSIPDAVAETVEAPAESGRGWLVYTALAALALALAWYLAS